MAKRYELAVPSPIRVVIHGEDGSRLLVEGTLDGVPFSAGGIAQQLRITHARARPMRPEET